VKVWRHGARAFDAPRGWDARGVTDGLIPGWLWGGHGAVRESKLIAPNATSNRPRTLRQAMNETRWNPVSAMVLGQETGRAEYQGFAVTESTV